MIDPGERPRPDASSGSLEPASAAPVTRPIPIDDDDDTAGFPRTARFEVRRKLGEGGMGVVFEALDRERGEVVAVKTMSRVDPSLIYQFKQEFRALADVVHPNLVGLHELLTIDDQLLFTMELVDGRSFLAHVREPGPSRADLPSAEETAKTMEPAPAAFAEPTLTPDQLAARAPEAQIEALPPRVRLPLDEARLREALTQLVHGLSALHDAGKLHRDIKPSNVLVTRDGRTVLLDFGLVIDLPTSRARTPGGTIAGTPAYMAPEHLDGVPLTAASDWYSVGAMLYETLTGSLPFVEQRSGWQHLLRLKRMFDPPPPHESAPHVDRALSDLCMGLLQRDPRERLDGRAILRCLAGEPVAPPRSHDAGAGAAALVGRERHVRALEAALARTREGHAVTVHVHGESGMGKSAVVRSFLDALLDRGEAVVLEGRCYERESVPYKGLDSLVDALSIHLEQMPHAAAVLALPRHIDALARIFPVLARVPAVLAAPRPGVAIPDPQELRRTAFGALRELLRRLSDRAPLVLAIDDLQWGDLDSAALLADLVSPPDPPRLLLVASARDGDPATAHGRSLLPRPDDPADLVDLEVGPLEAGDARALALATLGRDDEASRAEADAIARESRGNPFFVHELVRYVREIDAERGPGGRGEAWSFVSLDDLVAARVDRLSAEARRLLEIVAVAARPITASLARRAADIDAVDQGALAALRAGHMVRLRSARGQDEIEPFHDRVREGVAKRLAPDVTRARHATLATLLEEAGGADPEALAEHWRGAGEPRRAADHAIVAAGHAASALAFDRAAKLYRMALDLLAPGDARRFDLQAKLGDALAQNGRCAEAAKAFLAAAPDAGPIEALELRRRAGEQLLISGHIDEGLEVLGRVLGEVKMFVPRTPAVALVMLLFGRAYLWFRGYGTKERDASAFSQEELTRIDLCWAAALGLAMVDHIRGAYFQTQHIRMALRAGEPYRVARALGMEVGYRATAGARGRKSAEKLSVVARELAGRIGHPHTIGLTTVTAGMSSFLQGNWREGYELITEGEEILREQCTGVVSERTNATLYALRCQLYLGDLALVCGRLPVLIDEATERGDLYATTYLRLRYAYLVGLAADDPGQSRDMVAVATTRWSRQGFHIQHYLDVFATAEIDLYAGEGAAAWSMIGRRMGDIRRSLILRVQHLRIELIYLEARAALAAADASGDPAVKAALLREAERRAKKLVREGVAWADGLSHVLVAGVARARRDPAKSEAELVAATGIFEGVGMALHAAAARRARGEMTGDAGAVALAESAMRSQKIASPARWGRMTVGRFGPRDDAPVGA